MNVTIELMNASTETILPSPQEFQCWSEAVLKALRDAGDAAIAEKSELSIRIVDESESASLNETYRHKKGPTNILSFPCSGVPGTDINLLGDLAICAALVKQEAAQQSKSIESHWAHLTVHGVLHLQGFDHEEAAAAEEMETLEINILNTLGYTDPYQEIKGDE